MSSTSGLIGVDAFAGFATTAPHPCFHPGSPGQSRHRPLRSAVLGIGLGVALTLGCARIQPTVLEDRTTQIPQRSVIDRIVNASVKVAIEQDGHRVTTASGIVIASRPAGQDTGAVSYVLTSAHVLTGGDRAAVFVGFCGPGASRGKVAATVISQGSPGTLDLALLRVSGIAVPPVSFLEDDRVRLGRHILVAGFPEGQRLGISGGIVSQLPLSEIQNGIPADREDQRIVIDAAAPRGVSGGGVFDADTGNLIGVVQGHQTFSVAVKDQAQTYSLRFPVPGATFVVPMTQVRRFLASSEVVDELPGLVPAPAQATHLPGK